MNKTVKRGLIVHSLSPVFFLLILRHFDCKFLPLMGKFFDSCRGDIIKACVSAIKHPLFGKLLISIICIMCLFVALLYSEGLAKTQKAGFESHGERVESVEEKKEGAASFLMTFVFPLIIDDFSQWQYTLSYFIMLWIVCKVLQKTNLFYQSPVLALFNYHIYEFKVSNPYSEAENSFSENRKYIGITKQTDLKDNTVIRWKHVADDVYLVQYREKDKGE